MAKNPFFNPSNPFTSVDFTKWGEEMTKAMKDMKMPGVDAEGMMAAQQRNIEALAAANKTAAEGMQAVFTRQAEIMKHSMEEATAAMQSMMSAGAPEDQLAKQAELTKEAFESTISNMKELSEMMSKSQTEAIDILNERVAEGLEELRGLVQKGGKS